MFYSQIILAKKGPLGQVWLAANWGDRKLGRQNIFSTDISKSVQHIVNPTVPLALRLSGQLLLGIVRIYSRKVNYLMQDCNDAMAKIKMAYHVASSTDKGAATVDLEPRSRTSGTEGGGNLNVANFGEYQEDGTTMVVEPVLLLDQQQGVDLLGGAFCIPFELDDQAGAAGDEWVLAEEALPAEAMGEEGRQAMMRTQTQLESETQESAAADLTLNSLQTGLQPPEEEKSWEPFDPDEEERHVFDDSMESGGATKGRVSDVELVRAAHEDSMTSDPQIRRSSIADVGKEDDTTPITPGEYPQEDTDFPFADDTADVSNIPFDDSSQPNRPSGVLRLSPDTDDSLRGASIGGLDDTDLSNEPPKETPKRKRKNQGPRRMRKRRKVVIDNDATELTNDHIRFMLQDTDDICLQNRGHPANWIPQETPRQPRPLLLTVLPYERLLARPALGDDGALAPELLELWERNTSVLKGKPVPFRMRGAAGQEQREREAEEAMVEAAEEEVEVGRNQDSPVDEMGPEGHPSFGGDTAEFPVDFDEMPPPQEEEDVQMPFGDEESIPKQEDQSGFAEDMQAMLQSPDDRSINSRESGFSLGPVNDLEADITGDDEDAPRQQAGGDLASSNSKWHKHTVKVLAMLKRNMGTGDGEEEEKKPSQLSYDKLSFGCSRRTAAGVFFELLQLKTWDFIEVDQDESYGDISIAPGLRFNEATAST